MTPANAPLSLLGRGEAHSALRAQFDAAARAGGDGARDAAEAALAAIRYADPASWTVATAVARAIADARDAVLAGHDRVGVVVTSAEGPVEAIAAMAEASRAGSSSPIRFPASNAGSLVGIPAIGFTFRGPTLMLTLPPERGVHVGMLLANAWLRRGVAGQVLLAAVTHVQGRPVARCLLLAAPGVGPALDGEADGAWLAAVPG